VGKRLSKDSSDSRGKQKKSAPRGAPAKTRAVKPAAKTSPPQALEIKRGKSQAVGAARGKAKVAGRAPRARPPASPVQAAALPEVLAAAPSVQTPPQPASAAKAPSPKIESPPQAIAKSPPSSTAPAAKPPAPSAPPVPNFEALSRNIARLVEEGGKVLSAYLKPFESGEAKVGRGEEVAEIASTLGRVAEYYASDTQRAYQAQARLSAQFLELWTSTLHRLNGEEAPPVAALDPGDKRFADPEWRANPYFDFIKQAYVLTSRWADDLVRRADELDPHTRDKAAFYLKQVTSALSPSNFLATNPELLRTTLAESGDNLVRGLHMMAEDIEAGHGQLRIRQSDAAKFKLGVNLAVTPGKVVFRNELIELIQYAPTTPDVYKRPLLIVPPWINKFYILDLNPEKSFIRWAVAQGLTVFVVSWVNPDERHADKGFESYMREGIFDALDAIEAATGERDIAAIGYCVGGTLLAVALAFMAEIGDKRISSATFFTTQVDFTDPGDLKVFVDAEQLKTVEQKMAETGYLDGSQMANAFNMLRPNDLIWSYWVNNYLKGKEPMAFDLLVWNSDSTRMPAANHRFYLRHCYLQNDLTKGEMRIEGKSISLNKVTIPVYDLATKEDHIAPARSVFNGAKFFGGPVRYVLSGSGHIAGVVNPPDKPKYQFWTGGQPEGSFDGWLAAAKETPGSWWPDWSGWITAQAPEKVRAREPGLGKLKPLGDAPGDYVKVRV
jgi:polyhydroxyalkanoate synthase